MTGARAASPRPLGVRGPSTQRTPPPDAVDGEAMARLLAEADDPSSWDQVQEVGPGFFRAPQVGRQLAAALVS